MAMPPLPSHSAFDAVAAEYDEREDANVLFALMRQIVWQTLLDSFTAETHLLDLGCGTGTDALYLAARGFRVTGIDPSPGMVDTARRRVTAAALDHRVQLHVMGMEDMPAIKRHLFDGAYSTFGPFNCVTDLRRVATRLADLLPPGAVLVATVMGRVCPWEMLYYAAHGRWSRATVRFSRDPVPVKVGGASIPTRYYTPGAFARELAPEFVPIHLRSLGLVLPPPHLLGLYRRSSLLRRTGPFLEEYLSRLPLLRATGDHFIMVLRRRDEPLRR